MIPPKGSMWLACKVVGIPSKTVFTVLDGKAVEFPPLSEYSGCDPEWGYRVLTSEGIILVIDEFWFDDPPDNVPPTIAIKRIA